jgi:hypothetical protein
LKKISHPNFNRSIKPDRPKCDINIELKSYETAYKVVDLIENTFQKKNGITINLWFLVLIGMPYSRSLFKFKIAIGVLTETNLDLLAFAKFIQAKSIHPYFHHRRKYGQNAGRGFLLPGQ